MGVNGTTFGFYMTFREHSFPEPSFVQGVSQHILQNKDL
jgi:hypothetical protein